MTGIPRTAIHLAAAGTALTTVLTTVLAGGAALAETRQTTRQLPRNFLLYEARAREPVRDPSEERWTISSELSERLEINPCNLHHPADGGRALMRTVIYRAPLRHTSEQLVVYRSADAARKALAGLLGQVGKCATVRSGSVVYKTSAKRVRFGDQAMRVSVQRYDGDNPRIVGGQRAVVVRKGRALAIYLRSGEYGDKVRDAEFVRQFGDAGKMASKACSLPGVC